MNFYATQDCDTKVDFTVNTMPMAAYLQTGIHPLFR